MQATGAAIKYGVYGLSDSAGIVSRPNAKRRTSGPQLDLEDMLGAAGAAAPAPASPKAAAPAATTGKKSSIAKRMAW